MYKIVDRTGRQIGKELDSLRDALGQIKRIRRSGLKVIVVDTRTRIIKKRYFQVTRKK